MIEMQYGGGNIVGPDNTSTPDHMTARTWTRCSKQVPGIIASSPMLEFHDRISIGSGVTKDTMLLGVSPQYKEVRNLRIVAGRFFDDQDAAAHAKVAGHRAAVRARALRHDRRPRSGADDHHPRIPFTIIGVFEESFEHPGTSEICEPDHPDSLPGGALLHRHRQGEGDLLHHEGSVAMSCPPRSRSSTIIRSPASRSLASTTRSP